MRNLHAIMEKLVLETTKFFSKRTSENLVRLQNSNLFGYVVMSVVLHYNVICYIMI